MVYYIGAPVAQLVERPPYTRFVVGSSPPRRTMKKLFLSLKKMKATEADGWEYAKSHSCCPGDDWADGYNQAIKDVVLELKRQEKIKK